MYTLLGEDTPQINEVENRKTFEKSNETKEWFSGKTPARKGIEEKRGKLPTSGLNGEITLQTLQTLQGQPRTSANTSVHTNSIT